MLVVKVFEIERENAGRDARLCVSRIDADERVCLVEELFLEANHDLQVCVLGVNGNQLQQQVAVPFLALLRLQVLLTVLLH